MRHSLWVQLLIVALVSGIISFTISMLTMTLGASITAHYGLPELPMKLLCLAISLGLSLLVSGKALALIEKEYYDE